MKISINEDILETATTLDGKKFTLSELLICMIVKGGENPFDVVNDLLKKGVLIKDTDSDRIFLFRKYAELVEQIILESDNTAPKVDSLEELVVKLQELFPKERKPDANGIPKYSYRGNKRDITLRLLKFFKLYGIYSFDDVYKCTKRYVEQFKYDKTYMRVLPYFIMKDGESQLATELENMEDEDTISTSNDLNYGEALL